MAEMLFSYLRNSGDPEGDPMRFFSILEAANKEQILSQIDLAKRFRDAINKLKTYLDEDINFLEKRLK
jgi:hypothetical protein